jgi:hypothetical protein
MNKNLKRIIALALVFGTISAAAPAGSINFFTTKAYASTNSTDTLESLSLEKTNGTDIQLYDDDGYDSDNKVDNDDVKEGDTYYAKTSATTVKIKTDGPDDKYVRIFKGTSSSTKGKKEGDSISLSSGTETLVVRVYSSDPGSSVKYEDDSDVIGYYKIKVKCTGDSSTSSSSKDESDEYDDIYLDRLSVDGNSISLSKSKTTYTYDVTSDVGEVTVRAVPEDDDYTVEINGDDVDEDDKYKNDVQLEKGENDIEIKIEDDDDNERVYTLKIYRGGTTSSKNTSGTGVNTATEITTATSTPDTATVVTTATSTPDTVTPTPDAANQIATATPINSSSKYFDTWVQANGGWQYYDLKGNLSRNYLFYDKKYGKSYYLGTDGMMVSNCWIVYNNNYYYFYGDGSMATNAIIGSWKVGADGAWIH